MKPHSRYKVARIILISWCLFVGVGALFGAACMLLDPAGEHTGMAGLLPGLRKLPFADILFQTLTFSGAALLCVNGIPNLVAAGLLFANKRAGAVCGAAFGVTLMLWISIQFCIFPPNILSGSYFVFGLLQALTGCAALIFYEQEHFSVDPADYPNIGSDPSRLVVYFSRMGYTKKAAYEAAERTGASLYEVRATEPVAGTLGFWWCGRFGMHRWGMPIEPVSADLAAYEQVTVCSPIWVFRLSSPMRSFCEQSRGKVKQASCVLTHFQRCRYAKAAREITALLGVETAEVESICTRHGRVIARFAFRI